MTFVRPFTAGALMALVTAGALAQKQYDSGAGDTGVRIGQTVPLSGPVSAWGSVAKAAQAYFKMLNDRGGINGRKIELVVYDDGYEPARTVEMTRKAVESDNVLFMAGSMGTGPQLAVAPYLNRRKVPQLFLSAAASKLADASTLPYTIMAAPAYEAEGASWLKHLLATKPNAKVALLYQDDDAGRAIVAGFKQQLGKTRIQVVSEQTYTVTDPTINSQVISMKGSGADVALLITVPKMTAMGLRKIRSLGWEPTIYLSQGGSSIKTALEPAGLDNAKGVISAATRMSLGDAAYADHPEVREYLEFVANYLPGSAADTDEIYLQGYMNAAMTAHVIRQAGDDLTRANIMKVATSLRNYRAPALLPGVTLNTTPGDYRMYKQMQLQQFDGKNFVPLGPVVAID